MNRDDWESKIHVALDNVSALRRRAAHERRDIWDDFFAAEASLIEALKKERLRNADNETRP